MNKLGTKTAAILYSLLITGLHFSCSGEAEQQQQRVHLESEASSDPAEAAGREFYKELGQIPPATPAGASQGFETILHTPKPEAGQGDLYRISACVKSLPADLDADGMPEKICVRYLQHKQYDDRYTYNSLIVDVFKDNRQMLRQELNRGFFFEERFVGLKDLTANGKPELVTRVRFSPDCSGCSAHRIYTFHDGRFDLLMNLFNTNPGHKGLAGIIRQLAAIEDIILNAYRPEAESQSACDIWQDCVTSIPWIVNRDDDRLELILLAHPPADEDPNTDQYYQIFLAEFTRTGKLAGHDLFQTDLECCQTFVDLLGFIQTRDRRTHLLVNFSYGGTSSANPVLNIFDVQPARFAKIGEFAGFYEHAIAERLRDLNADGNTEIIYVGETYWPSGAAHADIVVFYDIAEYRGGRYVEANEKFKRFRDRLNDAAAGKRR